MDEELDIVGCPSSLSGLKCDELLVQEYWFNGKLFEQAHIVYFCFDKQWHELFIDCGIIHWRVQDSRPTEYSYDECDFKIVELSEYFKIKNVILNQYIAEANESGVLVHFYFANGIIFTLKNAADKSTFEVTRTNSFC